MGVGTGQSDSEDDKEKSPLKDPPFDLKIQQKNRAKSSSVAAGGTRQPWTQKVNRFAIANVDQMSNYTPKLNSNLRQTVQS